MSVWCGPMYVHLATAVWSFPSAHVLHLLWRGRGYSTSKLSTPSVDVRIQRQRVPQVELKTFFFTTRGRMRVPTRCSFTIQGKHQAARGEAFHHFMRCLRHRFHSWSHTRSFGGEVRTSCPCCYKPLNVLGHQLVH